MSGGNKKASNDIVEFDQSDSFSLLNSTSGRPSSSTISFLTTTANTGPENEFILLGVFGSWRKFAAGVTMVGEQHSSIKWQTSDDNRVPDSSSDRCLQKRLGTHNTQMLNLAKGI